MHRPTIRTSTTQPSNHILCAREQRGRRPCCLAPARTFWRCEHSHHWWESARPAPASGDAAGNWVPQQRSCPPPRLHCRLCQNNRHCRPRHALLMRDGTGPDVGRAVGGVEGWEVERVACMCWLRLREIRASSPGELAGRGRAARALPGAPIGASGRVDREAWLGWHASVWEGGCVE